MFGVGKTSLVRRFVHRVFEDRYLSTIGVQIYLKNLAEICDNDKSNDQLKLILWDLANIEKFTPTIKNYFIGAAAAIVVLDLTRPETFEEKNIYLNDFKEINPKAKLIFAGNKVDLIADQSSISEDFIATAKNYDSYYVVTSAKTGTNVESLFRSLGKQLLGCA